MYMCIGVCDKCHFLSYRKNIPQSTRYYLWELTPKILLRQQRQTNLGELRSQGAGLKPFTLSVMMLLCRPGSGYTSFGHYSWAKIVKIGVKIRLINNFGLVLVAET